MITGDRDWGPNTLSVHGGPRPAGENSPLAPPIYQSAVFTFSSLETVEGVFGGTAPGYAYSRMANPNLAMLEASLARWHRAEAAVSAATGMAAIHAALMALTSSGDRILMPPDLYGGTVALALEDLVGGGRAVAWMEGESEAAARDAWTENTRLVLVETVSNPLMKTADLQGLARLCRSRGALLVVDNTLASPVLCRPLELGAHLAVESATKCLAGHSTVMGGVLAGPAELIDPCRDFLARTGGTLDPFAAWLIGLGLYTLALRVHRASENAAALIQFLSGCRAVKRIFYPGTASDPGAGAHPRVMPHGSGSMLSFKLEGKEEVQHMMNRLELVKFAPSLGDVRTIISHPATTSHRDLEPEIRLRAGIADGLVRVSVGIEDLEDLQADFSRGLG